MINFKINPYYLNDEDIKWVLETHKNMTNEEKLMQLFFPIGYSSNAHYLQNDILNHQPGGLMFRTGPKAEIYEAFSYLQKHSKIPMFLAANLESGGIGIVEEGTFFGNHMQIAATDNRINAERLGEVSCREAGAVGCNMTFAPIVDIDLNYHNPITNIRTFGNDTDKIIDYASAYIDQAKSFQMATTIKHFPGDGVDEVDQHILTSVNHLSCDMWDQSFGKIYQTLINHGTLAIMAGHIALPSYEKKYNPELKNKVLPASLSKALLKNLLRKQLNFNGLIISDASPMVGFMAAMDREIAVPYAIEAGCDMILFNKVYEEDIQFMKNGFKKGILSSKRLDEAVLRILATKASMKLHVKQRDNNLVPNIESLNDIGNKEHQSWANICADEAITLVKDTQNLLPIQHKKYKNILIEYLGEESKQKHILKLFKNRLEIDGYYVTVYEKEHFDFSKPFKFESVTDFRKKYDLVIYVSNVENASNKTTNRINWHAPYGAGNNIPWFVEVVPTLFISLQNPYHLLDVPMIKTYINAYSYHDSIINQLLEKILGNSPFKGVNPIDPFCGKEYLKY